MIFSANGGIGVLSYLKTILEKRYTKTATGSSTSASGTISTRTTSTTTPFFLLGTFHDREETALEEEG